MKIKLITIAMIIGTTLTFSTVSKAANIAQSLCEYVAVDDKKRIRSFLKTNKLKIRSVFKGVKCNGKNLLLFADSSNSTNMGVYIIGKLPKKAVSANIASLTNKTLIDTATKRAG